MRARTAVLIFALVTAAWLSPLGTLASSPESATPEATPDETVVVFLVRHAEKVADGSPDPALTEAGQQRAEELVRLLGPRIDRVHSTDYQRTRDTAGPAAEALGVEIELYDPRRLGDVATALRGAPGRHLVVGHSNTTPQLIEALGGDVGEPVTEAHYDRLWIVTLPPGGVASTVELHFAAKSPETHEVSNGQQEP